MAVETQGHILPKVGSPSDASHPWRFPSLTGEEAQMELTLATCPVSQALAYHGAESTYVRMTAGGGAGVLSHSNLIEGIYYKFQNSKSRGL